MDLDCLTGSKNMNRFRIPLTPKYENLSQYYFLNGTYFTQEIKYSRFTQIYAMASKSLLTLAIDPQFSNPLKP
jgi:hypothetical protein